MMLDWCSSLVCIGFDSWICVAFEVGFDCLHSSRICFISVAIVLNSSNIPKKCSVCVLHFCVSLCKGNWWSKC